MTERLPRSWFLGLGLASIAHLAPAQVTAHLERNLGWANGPVNNAALDGRLSQAAAQYRSYAPVPRIAFYDIAFPKDCGELAATDQQAVLVVTAVVQDSTELPPASIYLRSGSTDTKLPQLAGVQSHVASPDVRATFGNFRIDVVYLLPIQPNLRGGDILLDFAAHRQGFRLAHLSGQVPSSLVACQETRRASRLAPESALWTLVRREYPDLSQVIAPKH